jgi:hypothetical protein
MPTDNFDHGQDGHPDTSEPSLGRRQPTHRVNPLKIFQQSGDNVLNCQQSRETRLNCRAEMSIVSPDRSEELEEITRLTHAAIRCRVLRQQSAGGHRAARVPSIDIVRLPSGPKSALLLWPGIVDGPHGEAQASVSFS